MRRLSFDLTGLPPSIAEIDAFMADTSDGAYERLVDRLLASPHYGERMAMKWLDLARYADTNGYHVDDHRNIWKFREWVIDAFNRNMPFDRFTIEQIAGDLLPNPTIEQRIASGFHRNVMVTSEGGADPEEYLTKYANDRVTTTATVWLGTTLACAECHDHKYDPFTQREFYRLYAYFNNMPELGLDTRQGSPVPNLQIPTPEQAEQLATLRRQVAELETRIKQEVAQATIDPPSPHFAPNEPQEYVWVDDELPREALADGSEGAASWHWVASPQPVLSGRLSSERTAAGFGQHFFINSKDRLTIATGDKLFAHVYLDPANPPQAIMLQFNNGNWEHRAYWGANDIEVGADATASRLSMGPLPEAGRWVRLEVDAAARGTGRERSGERDGLLAVRRPRLLGQGRHDQSHAASLEVVRQPTGLGTGRKRPAQVEVARQRPANHQDRSRQARRRPAQALRDYFVQFAYAKVRSQFEPLNNQLAELRKGRGRFEPRRADHDGDAGKPADARYVRARARRLSLQGRSRHARRSGQSAAAAGRRAGQSAGPGPVAGGSRQSARGPRDGESITGSNTSARASSRPAKTFGSRGQWPTHPELLDWLAAEFVDSGWDVKALQRKIVTSATYRQSAKVEPALLEHDPYNRLLARGPRFRLDAEMIRDNALAVSGLLNDTIGGPSVSPYQPAGLWDELGSGDRYVQSKGRDLYRRGMYVYWKRSIPYPPLVTFDAPNREVCTDSRARTNTPLQALVLLNDPAYVEAARVLAQRIMKEGGADVPARMAFAFRLCTARPPSDAGSHDPATGLRAQPGPISPAAGVGRQADQRSANLRAPPKWTRPKWPPGRRWATCC